MQARERTRVRKALAHTLLEARRAMVAHLVSSTLSRLGAGDLTMVQLAALVMLERGEAVAVSDVAARIGRSLSATSRLLDQLVRRGLLQRHEDAHDRRVRRVAIATAGRKLVAGLSEERAEAQLRLVDALTAGEQAIVARGMALLAKAARAKS